MAYVNFKNSPSEETPLTGGTNGNLNVMQENGTSHGADTKLGYAQSFLNDHIINVSNEVDEDYRVNLIVQDNLFVGTIEQGSITSTGETSDNPARIRTKEFINVQPDTTYQIKTTPTNTTLQLFVFEYTNNEVFVQRQPADWIDASYYIFKTSSTTGKIKIAFRYANNSNLLPSAITSLKVKENTPPSINVDGEEIYKYNVLQSGKGTWTHSSINYGNVYFHKIGNLVILNIQDLQVSANISSLSTRTKIASGLPRNTEMATGEFGILTNFNNGSTGYTVRVIVDENGDLYLNYANLNTNQRYYGVVVYISPE